MDVFEVITRSDKKAFIDFPKKLYENDPYWVCQLDTMVEAVFDPSKNQAFTTWRS
jgi:hypothetical protein